MKRLVPMFDNSGARYSIPEDRVDEFRADMGEVAEAKRYRGKDGQHYTIPQDQEEAFKADMPDAVPVRSYTMADGTRRDFTMGEMAKFLRSKEYREGEDAELPQQGSPTWADVKGALTGAAEGAYYGGKNALAKAATAIPEAAASVGEAVGNAVNLGGNAKNPVGDWLRASGQQTKRWLGENVRGDQYDENGNLVMSGLTKDLGYEDALTKIGETAGDAAAMAVKFAPAAIAGPAYMETILASDGINAYANTFDRAIAAGYSVGEANLAGAASGLINYYGAKLMMKGGAATKDIANPLLRALGGTAFTGAATAAQAVGNKGVENAIEGRPTTEGMLGAAGEGFVEGAQFHLINEVGTNAKQSMAIRRETREMKEMRKENLLTATETPDGRAFLDKVVQNEGVEAAVKARKEGKDISRKMGAAADLPDNMSAAERNAVIDGIIEARGAKERLAKEQETAKAKYETSKETAAAERRAVEARMAENEQEAAMGDLIEREGAEQRANAEQSAYDEKMAAYEEARAKRAAEKKRGVAKEKLTPLPEKPTPPELRVEEQKKPVAEADLSENPAKVPDGRGKMVEKQIETAKDTLESLKRIASDENVLPKVSDEKLIETLNDERAKDPKYADLIGKVKAELEKRGKLPQPSQPLENAPSRAPIETKKTAEQIADEYAKFVQKRIDRFNSAKTSKDFAYVRDFFEGEYEANEAIRGSKEAIEIFNRKYGELYKTQQRAVHDATTRENELRESERKAYEASDEGRLAKRDNAIATLQKGLGISLKSFLDGGWRIVKRTNGAVPRWSLAKEGVDEYYDLSKKSVKKFMSEREHAESIKSIKEWYDAEDAKKPTAEKSSVVAPASQADGVTAESLRDRAKTDPELRRLDDAQKKAKTDAERNAILAKAQERIGELRKEMEAEAKVEKPKAVEKQKKNKPLTDLSDSAPLTRNVEGIKAEEKAAKAKFKAEKTEILSEVEKAIADNDGVLSKKSIDGNNLYDAWVAEKKRIDRIERKSPRDITPKEANELVAAKARLMEIEKEAGHAKDTPTVEIEVGGAKYSVKNDPLSLRQFRENVEKRFGKEASKRYYEKSPSMPADRTADPAIVAWAKKRGEPTATGADGVEKVSEETVRRFNADQIGRAVNATKNLIKGVKVETVGREWSDALDNPDGADKSVKLKREGRVVGTYDPATKKVRLYSGADASTVYHELIGHAVHDWAKDNSKPLYEKLNALAKDAPKELVDAIRRNYPDADEATLAKEIIAHIAGKKGVENITPKLKDKPTTWYARAYVTVRDAILDFIQKIGFRRIDVKKLESMSPMEAMDYLTEQAAKGRMLGKAEAEGDGALTKLEKWAVAMYDRYMPITKVSKDAADAKALQPGKEYDFQLRNFDVKKREFGKMLAESDIAGESVADYMRAQSAPERNRRLREEFLKENKGGNPSDYDLWVQNNGGSGWSDERAAEHMKFFNSLPEARRNAIKKAADFLWKMQKEGMERRVEAGLISREDADALMAAEQYHIPWKSAISEFDGEWRPWRGKNNFKSGEFAKAKGRATEAGDPIAWMFEEFSDAHLRAIENETRSILARDIEASGKFGKVVQNTPQNQMKELRVKGGEGQANVVNFKRGGKTYSIVLEGERGDAIASGYTNRDLAHMPKKVQAFMRLWSATATEWSPTFAVRNLIADNLDVARIVLAEQGVKQGVKTLAKYAVNRQRVAKEIMQYAWTGEMKKGGILEQYSKEGGMIGGFQRQGYENLREQMSYENIRKQFEKDAKKGRNRTRSVLSLVPKAFVGIGHGIKTVNAYAELSSRVAMFKTNVDAGMSAKDAALYSRRITVDFNRKGNYTPVLNTVFMFSNSTLGATMRQVEAIHKGWEAPQGKRALALLFLQGLATSAAEAWINGDDDENEKLGKGTWKDMPEHNYTSRLGIRVGDKFYGLPGHDDPLSRISWLGSSVGRMFFGKMKKADFAKEIGSFGADMAGRFAGKGSTDIASGWNALAPSALQWFVQALENKDFAGRPIQRPKFDDAKPWSQNGRASTPQSYKTVAEVLNAIGGGNEAKSGKLFGQDWLSTDYSPEMIRHVFNSVFKNVGRDAGDLISMAEVGLHIADFDIRNAPIARNLVTKSNGNDNRFFEARKAFDADKNEFDKRTSWGPGEKKQYLAEHPWLRKGSDSKRTVDRLINMTNRDNPRSGLGSMGITQLRKLTEGKVRRKDGSYFEPKTPVSDELKERAREWLQKRQARVIEIMGK